MSKESIATATTSGSSFDLNLIYVYNSKIAEKREVNYLKQAKVSFTNRNIVKIFIVLKLDNWSRDLNTYFPLKDSLFGAFNQTENATSAKYSYFEYGIERIHLHIF